MEPILTKLSSDDNYDPNGSLQRLLDLDGEIMDMGEGYWVKIEVRKIEPTRHRPQGIAYALCLFSPDDERLICFDNAHPISVGSGPARKTTEASDHVHKKARVQPYGYSDPEKLMSDFWTCVDEALKERGVQ